MIIILLVSWSILAVEVLNPVNQGLIAEGIVQDEWCQAIFTSVAYSTLAMFQTLVAGDSWGTCIIPVVRQEPWTFVLFTGALACVQLGFTNLILSVIVDQAAEAKQKSQ